MRGALIQDWVTLKGGAGVTIVQPARDYLDTAYLQDLVFWIDVRTAASSVSMTYETAPQKEEGLFLPMTPQFSLTVGSIQQTAILAQDAVVPPARWVRWAVTSSSAWSVTFRLFLSANQVGP